tara:strand:+ start:117 stop:1268 length:1152 start_codon:yes stop_codon:yes gene_type:complete
MVSEKMIKIIGQDFIWEKLKLVKLKNKVSNAYLFYGPDGTGKEGMSIKFSALLNCLNKNLAPCGKCGSCLKIKTFQHSNISLIIPLPKEKTINKNDNPDKALSNKTLEFIIHSFKEKIKNPYLEFKIPKANTILINSIRDIRKKIYMKSFEEGYKCVLIFEAEKLMGSQQESANALLKILEDTPSNSTFILCTQYPNKLSNTIKSRCQSIYFPPLKENEINTYISENYNFPNENSKIISSLSNGSLKLVNKIILNDFEKIQKLILKFVADLTSNFDSRKNLIIELSKDYKFDTEKVKLNLNLLSFWFRDCFYISRNNKTSNLIFSNLVNELNGFILKYPKADYAKIIKLIDNCIDDLNRNLQINLVFLNLTIEINKKLNKKEI